MLKISEIAGVDEVGRGCLSGPVFSAAVILNNKIDTKNIKDSKKIVITSAREVLYTLFTLLVPRPYLTEKLMYYYNDRISY